MRISTRAYPIPRAFTGDYIGDDIPIFDREEYEYQMSGYTEAERFSDYMGFVSNDPYFDAETYAYEFPALAYGKVAGAYRCTGEGSWHYYRSGWVHDRTGEYVKGIIHPVYSLPIWAKDRRHAPSGYEKAQENMRTISYIFENIANGGHRDPEDEDDAVSVFWNNVWGGR